MSSYFDRLPVIVQHAVVLVLSALLGWGTTDLVPFLQGTNPLVAGLVGAVLTVLVGAVTPLTLQYGAKFGTDESDADTY